MRRTLIELLHVALGVAGTVLLAGLAAWAVPLAQRSIWEVASVTMAVVAGLGLGQLREAWRADRASKRAGDPS